MSILLKEKIYLVLGIGTDVGKSFFVENICKNLGNESQKVMAIKPISSGFKDDDKNSDSARILTALGKNISKENLDEISPWRFEKAVSPHFAAKNLNQEINFESVKKFCFDKISKAKESDSFLFIEAAGGIMTPINFGKTFLDLACELQVPVLLITTNYLGAISHTLSAIKVLESEKIIIEKVVLNEFGDFDLSIFETLKNFTKNEVVLIKDLVKNFLD